LLIKIRVLKYAGRHGRTISDQIQHGIVNQMSEDLEEDQDVTAYSHSITCLVKTDVKRKRRKINICSKLSTYAV
jgi:rRNA maturation protein Rpf1